MKRKAHISTNRLSTTLCPGCGAHLEDATGVEFGSQAGELPPAPVPQEGDLAICVYCGSLLKYGANLSLLKTSKQEEQRAMASPGVGEILRWRRAKVAKKAVSRN